ncbi:MAG: prepilin peptidase [Treponema sp.]|nr:prepilin peptidase [Treponema sp.]
MVVFYKILQWIIIVSISFVSSIQDLKKLKVNDYLLWCGFLLMLITHTVFIHDAILKYLLGSILLFFVFFIARLLSRKKLGLADLYFAAFSGLAFSWNYVWVYLMFASIIAGSFYTGFFISNRHWKNVKIPFIPFLSFALVITKTCYEVFG